MTMWRMRFTCWVLKATNTQSECVILIDFPNIYLVALCQGQMMGTFKHGNKALGPIKCGKLLE
jgi:hypothetical protein